MPKRRDGIMTVRIPSDEKDLLQAIADKADVTLSDVVVRAVRDFIEDNPIPAKGKKKSNS
jgi:predicted transcriptional regulator